MKKTVIWLLLLALMLTLAGCGEQPVETEAPTESSTQTTEASQTEEATDEAVDFSVYENKLTVLCYNIYYKDVERRSANIQDLILKNDPDVLFLQEVSVDWIPYLQSFMAENGYSYYGYGRYGGELSAEDLQSGDQFVPILWKSDCYDLVESGHFWLSSTPDTYSAAWVDGTISNYPRCVNWVILQDKRTGGQFFALNIHTDPESDIVRTNSCALTVEMLQTLSKGLPVVMGGDWNMGLTDSGYNIVTKSGYADVRLVAEDTVYGGSFNAWGERADDNYAYGDHLFISDAFAAEKFDVVNDYYDDEHISDHCPLLAVLYYDS